VNDFQTWEKMLKGRANGEWQEVVASVSPDVSYKPVELFTYLQGYYASQEYKPSANGCGGGSGFSGGGSFNESYSVLSSSSDVLSGIMGYESQTSLFPGKKELAPGECVTCPFCGNKKNNKLVKEKYICGNRKCKSNKTK
jgi:hypothetical protein